MTSVDIETIAKIIGFVGGLIVVYVQLSNKISELDIRLRVQEKQEEKVINKLDTLIEEINDLKIQLQNKENRRP